IFAVQDDISTSVAGALKVALQGGTVPKTHETNPDAYNAYLQGHYYCDRRTKEDVQQAINYFQRSLQIDPNYARAWAALAAAHSLQGAMAVVSPTVVYPKARIEAQKAVELDPNLAEAYSQLGWIARSYDWDWAASDKAYKRALQLEPENPDVLRGAAFNA